MNFLELNNFFEWNYREIDFVNFIDINDSDDDKNEEDVRLRVRAPKRYVRDALNPFEYYDDNEFKRRFRFSKESVLHGIYPKIEEGLERLNKRGLPIPGLIQLLVCLRFYSTASFQLVLGDVMRVSHPTVSRIVFRVSMLIASLMIELIKMPTSQEAREENQHRFTHIGRGNGAIGLPGVDGAIDCTRIRLSHTRLHQIGEVYRNRKGYFSLNVQAVVGPRMEFLDIVPEWPGSQHDSRIFQNSRIHMRYVEREQNGILLGDAGYPSMPFLITPLANPMTDAEIAYNGIHVRTRQIVERTFGVWKRRFPCLSRGLTTKLLCSTTIVVACAVLHNLSLVLNDIFPVDDELFNEEEEIPVNPIAHEPGAGFAVREALIARLFH